MTRSQETRLKKLEQVRSARPRRYCFYFDEEAEAKAQGLPYILVPRQLSREEWIEQYSGDKGTGEDDPTPPYRLSPAMNSCATCRLNSMLWERCLAMAFILSPAHPVKSLTSNCLAPGAHSNQHRGTAEFDPSATLVGAKSRSAAVS
jgi:hypothetical protein